MLLMDESQMRQPPPSGVNLFQGKTVPVLHRLPIRIVLSFVPIVSLSILLLCLEL